MRGVRRTAPRFPARGHALLLGGLPAGGVPAAVRGGCCQQHRDRAQMRGMWRAADGRPCGCAVLLGDVQTACANGALDPFRVTFSP